MRYYIVLLLFFGQQLYSQDLDVIKDKAKLLTMNRYGLFESLNENLDEVLSQKVEILSVNLDRFVFLKIEFGQRYIQAKADRKAIWVGSCSYILGYNREYSKFYRIGGFENEDLSEFFDDLTIEEEMQTWSIDEEFSEDIDFHCLRKYSKLSKKKKLRGKNLCFPNCSKEISNTLIVH